MPDLRNEPTLQQSDEPTAIMPVVNDNTNAGKPRKITPAIQLAAAQQRVRPVGIELQKIPLVEYSGGGDHPSDDGSANNLDIRTGSDRHSFDDGYVAFEFALVANNNDGDLIHAVPASVFNKPLPLNFVTAGGIASPRRLYSYIIERVSATSFVLYASAGQASSRFFKGIYGIRETIG